MNRKVVAAALFLLTCVPSVAQAATLRPIDQDGLNLRAGPGTGHQVVATLAAGQSAKVLEEKDGWYKVLTAAGQEAWAAGWVSRVNFEDEQAEAVVDTDVLNLRLTPHLTAKVQAVLKQNDRVRLLEIAGDWWRIRTAAGIEGWVAGQYMKRVAAAVPQTPPVQTPSPAPVQPSPTIPPAQPSAPTVGPAPAAPASAVPVLPFLPPAPATIARGNKTVQAVANSTVYAGRDKQAFDWVGSIKIGEQLTFLDAAEGWVKVVTPRKEQGWVPGATVSLTEGKVGLELTTGRWTLTSLALTPAPPAPVQPAPAPVQSAPVQPAPAPATPGGNYIERRIVRDAAGTSLNEKPSSLGRVIKLVPQGEVLEIIELKMPWMKANAQSGGTGWVHVESTEPYTASAAAPAPTPAPAQPAEPVPAPVQPAQPAPAPAQPVQPAPAEQGGTYIERRVVRDADGSNLRETPSLLGRVIKVLPQGDVLNVVELKMPWIKVNAQSGGSGWVHVDYTSPYTGSSSAPAPAPTPAPQKLVADGAFRATLREMAPGILQLDVEAPGKQLGEPVAAGTTLTIAVPGIQETTVLPVASAGATALGLSPSGLTLSLEQMPVWQVIEKAPGKVSVVLRPSVTGVTVSETADRTVYTFRVTGPVPPRTRAAGAEVVVEFPGATSTAASLPASLRAAVTVRGTEYAVVSNRPYALKRVAGGFELHLYKPGLAGKTILLDPGHGGGDSGAVSKETGLREKDANLQISLRLRAMLAAKGANVMMTRIDDRRVAPPEVLQQGPQDDLGHVDLGYRTRMANEIKADLFLSVHNNCCSGSGTETYYTATTLNGDRSATLARLMQQYLAPGLGQIDRGAKADLMYVTRTTDVPAALVEIAFVSHAIEGKLLGKPEYQEQAAGLMLKAIEQFFAERPATQK